MKTRQEEQKFWMDVKQTWNDKNKAINDNLVKMITDREERIFISDSFFPLKKVTLTFDYRAYAELKLFMGDENALNAFIVKKLVGEK